MDESETYANMRFTGADSQSPSRAEPDVSYVELNVTALSAPRVRRDGAGLSSTYAEVNCPKDEPVIDEDEAPPIAAGSRKQTTNAQTGAHEQEPKQNIENRRYMKICLLCLFTSVLIAIVAGLSIYVSQIRQSKFTVDRNYDELNSTLQSKINEIEAKYKAVNETKAQICELLTSRRGPHKQESKENIGNRAYHKICLLCLVTSILVAIVAGLSIHVSRTRQSLITSDRNYRRLWEQHQEMNRTQRQYQQRVREFNSTLKSRTSENSRLDLSQRNCLNNISALNNNLSTLENSITVLNSELSELNQTHTDLCHECNRLETKYRTITETKAQICQYLNRRRGQTCPQFWQRNEDRCYFISSLEKSYDEAREYCSDLDARLLEINSKEEKDFVSSSIGYGHRIYWIGKCRDGNVASNLLYKMYYGSRTCSKCNSNSRRHNCESKYGFICEKSAYLYPDIPEEIQGLCQHPVGPDLIK
ncbi:uncharacterized protein [Mobula birostris]|uniref:uncharacterized protein isoform X2 n=1 Tax=Mobula birostris TaxID=1983395 RepID=UPI003B287A5D